MGFLDWEFLLVPSKGAWFGFLLLLFLEVIDWLGQNLRYLWLGFGFVHPTLLVISNLLLLFLLFDVLAGKTQGGALSQLFQGFESVVLAAQERRVDAGGWKVHLFAFVYQVEPAHDLFISFQSKLS